ncbi:MAG: hypothetical protein H0W70_02865 [Actinobacteria bacterium]|nr:hypothetical protein [Actinomycetota bacterium]
MRRPSLASLCSLIAVAAAVLFVFWQLKPELLFANTTPSGGDMGAHVWGPAFLRDHLLAHGRLTGWTPDWYMGFPLLTFYFPLPSLLIVVLDVLLPYGVAFKLVTVMGVLALPVAAYVFARLVGLRGSAPACVAVLTVPFLFERSYTIYGGNIASTLAGEFSFSISLAAALLFLGVFARCLETGRGRGLAAVLLAVTGLCHLLPTIFAVGGAVVLLALRFDRRRLRLALPVAVVAAMLGAFWWLPFLMRLPYTTDMGWEPLTTYHKALLPTSLQIPLILAALGAATSLVLRRRAGVFLLLMAAASAVIFMGMPAGRLWNARVLPFWFLSVYLLAGIGVAVMGEAAAAVVGALTARAAPVPDDVGDSADDHAQSNGHGASKAFENVAPTRAEYVVRSLTPVVVAVVFLAVTALPLKALPASVAASVKTTDSSFIPGWVRWNYEGYERKAAYPEYRDVIATMARVGRQHGCGRSSWEYEPELDRYGTPMALMLLPYWTKGCIGSMEGLYFESSATTPYHFLSNSELSLRPPRPQRDLPYRDLDLRTGVQHLQLMGVRYYMALSEAAQSQARVHPDLKLVDRSNAFSATVTESGKPAETKTRSWEVYEVAHTAVVAPLSFEPVVARDVPKGGKKWQNAAVDWFQGDPNRWEVPLAASGPKEWARVGASAQNDPPRRAVRQAKVTNIRTGDDRISFDVDRPGTPVLVKASYFPNWRPSGARGPWRVTPNSMVVIPTARHVTLHYGETPVDLIGWALTYLGVLALVFISRRPLDRSDDFSEDEDPDEELRRMTSFAPELEPQPA